MTKKQKIIKWGLISIFVILAAWGLRAEAAEAGIGLSKAVSHDSKWIGQNLYLGNRDWYLDLARLGGEDKLPDTTRYTAGFRIDWREEKEFAPYIKLGVAYFKDEPNWVISDQWAYDMSLGTRIFKVIDLEYNHNSTGGRTNHNKGNDMLTLYLVREFN